MAWARAEVISAFIRIWPDGANYGEEWSYGINLRGIAGQPKGCELFGATRAPTKQERAAIGRCLQAMGYEWFLRTRGDGRQTRHSVHHGRKGSQTPRVHR